MTRTELVTENAALSAELAATRALHTRIRALIRRTDIDAEAKVMGVVLLFKADDARQLGYQGISVSTPEGTYEVRASVAP